MTKWDLSQICRVGSTFETQLIQSIISTGKKNNMAISTDAEKAFDKIHHQCLIKALSKVGIEGKVINLIKNLYKNPTAIITE